MVILQLKEELTYMWLNRILYPWTP